MTRRSRVDATRKAIDSGPGAADPAVREAAETMTILLSRLSRRPPPRKCGSSSATSRRSPRPPGREVDPALLEQDAVTAVVQIQGKVRARLEVSPEISEADLEAAALADETVLAGDRRPRGATRHRARPSWSTSSCDLRADG